MSDTPNYELDTAELNERVAVDLAIENDGPTEFCMNDLVTIRKRDAMNAIFLALAERG